MFSHKKIVSTSLFKNSFIYIVTDGINKAIPFLLLPFLTYYFTTVDYGTVTNFNVFVQILSVFYCAASGVIPVMYYKMDREKFTIYLSNLLLLNTTVILLFIIAFPLYDRLVYSTLKLPLQFQVYSLLIVLTSSITYVNMLLWRCEEKAFAFGKYQLFQSLLNVCLTVVLVIILLQGWQGRVYSQLITSLVFGIISFVILLKKRYIRFRISKEYLISISLFALPLVPHAIALWAKTGADKILLTNMCGLSENGLYSTAMTLGAIVTMVLASFSNAYAPFLYKKLSRIDKGEENVQGKRQIVKLTWLIIALTFLLVVIVYFISILIIKYIYNPAYLDSIKFLPGIMLSQFFYGGYLMFVCYCHYTFKTKILGMITFSLVVVQILLSWLLIGWIGAVGAAVSSAIASFLIFIFVAGYAMKVYKLPWFTSFRLFH